MMVAPRRWAASASSMTSTQAASDITNPSRPTSNGREAVAGSSLRAERTRIMAKAPSVSGAKGASAPPASAMSTLPSRMAWSA